MQNRVLTIIGAAATLGLFALAALALCKGPLALKICWAGIVPIAPLLFFFAPNLWMSACPFAFLQAQASRFFKGPKISIQKRTKAVLEYLAWVLLFVLVPLRHVLFDIYGQALFLAIVGIGGASIVAGIYFLGMSGWCSSLCPVRPVEALYGQFSFYRKRSVHCRPCCNCTESCGRMHMEKWTESRALTRMAYFFPGFVVGFFLSTPYSSIVRIYLIEAMAMAASGLFFFALKHATSPRFAIRFCALSAFCLYYAFSIPSILKSW